MDSESPYFAENGTDRPDSIPEQEQVPLRQVSQFTLYWERFRSQRFAVLGVVTIMLLILMAIFAPFLTGGAQPWVIHPELGFSGHPPTLENFPWRIFGTTGNLNGSTWSQVAFGARISLLIGFTSALSSSAIGIILGALSGYFSGWIDMVLMRITDIFLAIPFLPLLIAISAVYAQGRNNVVLIIAIFALFGWMRVARLVRAEYLVLREQAFIEAARAAGVNTWRIIFRHILPNALGPVIVATTLAVASNLTLDSALDFLNLGLNFQMGDPSSLPTWGNILADSLRDIPIGNWWWPLFPGIFYIISILAVNFVGEGLREALNVRVSAYS
jgi:peptide/nickel transport system permease protein